MPCLLLPLSFPFSPSAFHTSLICHLSVVNSPQQPINAMSFHSINCAAVFLLSHPTQPDSYPPCIPCKSSINLFPKRIKSVALINEGGNWTNSKVLISDSGIHTKCTTTKNLFSYICHPSLFEKAESLSLIWRSVIDLQIFSGPLPLTSICILDNVNPAAFLKIKIALPISMSDKLVWTFPTCSKCSPLAKFLHFYH